MLGGAAAVPWRALPSSTGRADGSRLVYHTPGPGRPDVHPGSGRRQARVDLSAASRPARPFPGVVAGPGVHLLRARRVPDRMDIGGSGRPAARRNGSRHHNSLVSHPVFLNARTLVYLATDADDSDRGSTASTSSGRPVRVSTGLERYTSLAASADGPAGGDRVRPKRRLSPLHSPGTRRVVAARPIPLTTGTGSSPRLGAGYLLYVSRTARATVSGSCRATRQRNCGARPKRGSSARPQSRATDNALPSRRRQTGRRCSTRSMPTARTRASSPGCWNYRRLAWAPDGSRSPRRRCR